MSYENNKSLQIGIVVRKRQQARTSWRQHGGAMAGWSWADIRDITMCWGRGPWLYQAGFINTDWSRCLWTWLSPHQPLQMDTNPTAVKRRLSDQFIFTRGHLHCKLLYKSCSALRVISYNKKKVNLTKCFCLHVSCAMKTWLLDFELWVQTVWSTSKDYSYLILLFFTHKSKVKILIMSF